MKIIKKKTINSKKRNSLWRTLLNNKMAVAGGSLVLFFILIAVLAPLIAPGSPDKFAGKPNLPPSAKFWLGTSHLGKDVFKQTVWGARNSLLVGFGTSFVATFVALLVGMTAGYFRGVVDDMLSLIMNLFLVIPGLPLLIVLSGYLKPGTTTVIFVLALTGWAFAGRHRAGANSDAARKRLCRCCQSQRREQFPDHFPRNPAQHDVHHRRDDDQRRGLWHRRGDGPEFSRPDRYQRSDLGHQPVLGPAGQRSAVRILVDVYPLGSGGGFGHLRPVPDQLRDG